MLIMTNSDAMKMTRLFDAIHTAFAEIEDLRPGGGFKGNPTGNFNIESLLHELAEQAKESREWKDKHERAAVALGLACRAIHTAKLQLAGDSETTESLVNYFEQKAIEYMKQKVPINMATVCDDCEPTANKLYGCREKMSCKFTRRQPTFEKCDSTPCTQT